MVGLHVSRLHRPHSLDLRLFGEAHELLHALHRLVPANVRELDVHQLPRVQRAMVVPALWFRYYECYDLVICGRLMIWKKLNQ